MFAHIRRDPSVAATSRGPLHGAVALRDRPPA
jgi:hypothetical protein